MSWIIGILTFVLVLDSVFLILLILIQLPKKEAGLGTAFGSSTTDALFGAGTGNVLTKLTKYCTIVFFAITLSLSVMNAHQSRTKKSSLEQTLKTLGSEERDDLPALPSSATTNPPAVPPAPAPTNVVFTATNVAVPVPSPAPTPAPVAVPAPTPEKPTDAPAQPADAPEKPAEKPAETPPPAPPPQPK